MKRREFLTLTAATCASYLVPHCRAWAYRNGNDDAGGKKLIVVILRGGIDGLNVIVPHGDPDYYAIRPTIGLQRGSLFDLDGHFGMHPALAALEPFWKDKTLA